MLNTITTIYFMILPPTVFLLSFTDFTDHGRIKKGISKKWFILFYALTLMTNLIYKNYNFFTLHIFRRLCESLYFRYKHGKMSILHFIHGIIYYQFLTLHLKYVKMNIQWFYLLNFAQFIAHFLVFKKRSFIYSHYICEFLIYFCIFVNNPTIELLFNLCYILIFIGGTIIKRYRKKLQLE